MRARLTLRAGLAALACAWAMSAMALEIERIELDADRGVYRLDAASVIDAPPHFVYAILVDFDNFYRLTDGIVETRRLPPGLMGYERAYTRVETCVLFFCRRIEKVDLVSATPNEALLTTAIPEESDFRIYVASWRLTPGPAEDQTRVAYAATMDPDFWVPPLIGPWAIERKLRQTAEQMAREIERLYQTGGRLADLPDR